MAAYLRSEFNLDKEEAMQRAEDLYKKIKKSQSG